MKNLKKLFLFVLKIEPDKKSSWLLQISTTNTNQRISTKAFLHLQSHHGTIEKPMLWKLKCQIHLCDLTKSRCQRLLHQRCINQQMERARQDCCGIKLWRLLVRSCNHQVSNITTLWVLDVLWKKIWHYEILRYSGLWVHWHFFRVLLALLFHPSQNQLVILPAPSCQISHNSISQQDCKVCKTFDLSFLQ